MLCFLTFRKFTIPMIILNVNLYNLNDCSADIKLSVFKWAVIYYTRNIKQPMSLLITLTENGACKRLKTHLNRYFYLHQQKLYTHMNQDKQCRERMYYEPGRYHSIFYSLLRLLFHRFNLVHLFTIFWKDYRKLSAIYPISPLRVRLKVFSDLGPWLRLQSVPVLGRSGKHFHLEVQVERRVIDGVARQAHVVAVGGATPPTADQLRIDRYRVVKVLVIVHLDRWPSWKLGAFISLMIDDQLDCIFQGILHL